MPNVLAKSRTGFRRTVESTICGVDLIFPNVATFVAGNRDNETNIQPWHRLFSSHQCGRTEILIATEIIHVIAS